MRTTIDIDEKLVSAAMRLTKTETKKEIVNLSLQEFIKAKMRERFASRIGKYRINLTLRELEKIRKDV